MSKIFRIIIAVALVLLVFSAILVSPDLALFFLIAAMGLGILLFDRPVRVILFITASILLLTVIMYAAAIEILAFPEYQDVESFYTIVALGSTATSTGLIVFSILMLLYVSSEWILGMSQYLGMTRAESMRLLAARIGGLQQPYQIVSKGERSTASKGKWSTSLGGPGLLIVKPSNAAVLEWGGNTSRIVGPGMHTTRMFEIPRGIIDLSPQTGVIRNRAIPTKEGVELRVTAKFTYSVENQILTRQRPHRHGLPVLPELFPGVLNGQVGYRQDPVGRAVYRAGPEGWKPSTEQAIAAALQDVLSTWSIIKVFGPQDASLSDLAALPGSLIKIATKARLKAWERTAEWGVCVETLDLDIQTPDNVQQRILSIYDAESEFTLISRRGAAEANVLNAIATERINASRLQLAVFDSAIKEITGTIESEHMPMFLSFLTKMAEELNQDHTKAFRYFHTLEAMGRNPDATVLLNTSDSDIILDAKK